MKLRFIYALALLVSLFFISNRADAACTPVSGTGESTDGVCTTSPLGLCTSGPFSGDLAGTYVGSFTSLLPAPTLAKPLRLAITLNSTITTSTGTLNQTETGYLVLNDTLGAAACITGCLTSTSLLDPNYVQDLSQCLVDDCLKTYTYTTFIQNMTPVSGTGSFSSVTGGSIVATGYGDPLTAISYVDYSGSICE